MHAAPQHAPGATIIACASSPPPPGPPPQDMEAWERLDDVIMGGSSSSSLRALEDGSGAVWSGDLIVEVGGGRTG